MVAYFGLCAGLCISWMIDCLVCVSVVWLDCVLVCWCVRLLVCALIFVGVDWLVGWVFFVCVCVGYFVVWLGCALFCALVGCQNMSPI